MEGQQQKESKDNIKKIDYDFIFENDMVIHIMNGLIETKTRIYPMIEFKIKDENNKLSFERVNYHCGWFYLDLEKERPTLIGPFKLNLDKIKSGVRIIDDDLIPEINKLEISGISNDESSLIPSSDYPEWIKQILIENII